MIATGNHNFERFAALCNTPKGAPRALRANGSTYSSTPTVGVLHSTECLLKSGGCGRILSAPTVAAAKPPTGRHARRPLQKRVHLSSLTTKKASPIGETSLFVLALPIFPASHPASIVGADELNFCVRDGNRWTLIAINTNYVGWVLPISFMSKPSLGSNCFLL